MRARPAAWCHAPAFITCKVQAIGWAGAIYALSVVIVLLTGRAAHAQAVTNAQQDTLEQRRAQDALITRGFVTSRILVQPQDLSGSNLVFTVLPGSLHQVRPTPAMEPRTLASALPMREGDLLNLRDIEQALENFQRAPTSQVDIQIAPASTPDQSDLIITSKSSTPVRVSFSLDDSGSKSTGRYQASGTLSWDNPLGLNDLFYISLGSDAQGGDPGPRGNQSITGQTTGYIYKGESGSTELKASYLFNRDASSKDTVYLKALERHARNFVNTTEVLIQRRASALWELGWEHKAFINQGTARPNFYTADLNWSTPWPVWKLPLAYQVNLRVQATEVALTAPDRFNLGGRHTVRGFDGENSISGDAGWLARQTALWPVVPWVCAFKPKNSSSTALSGGLCTYPAPCEPAARRRGLA